MSYFDTRHDLIVRANIKEKQMTGLYCVGFNDFHSIKPMSLFTSKPFRTIHIIFSGKGSYLLNGKKYQLHGGQMFFTPANTPICYFPEENDPWRYVWFSFSSESLTQYMPLLHLDADNPVHDLKHPDTIFGLLEKSFSDPDTESNRIFSFLSTFMQILALEADPIESDESEKMLYIRSIKECIESNYSSQDFSVDMLCDILHLSHSYICRIFRASEGMTIIGYIEDTRLQHACELLIDTDYPVSRIANLCGYRDPLHFMKCFKKKTGMTAVQYRTLR